MENFLPKTWKAKTLADIAQIERGKFTHRPRNDPRFYGGKIPFVQTGDISNSNGRIREYKQTLNEDGLAISKVFPQGTILITIAANIGYTGILEFDSACPDSLIGITTNDEVYPDFLNFYLMTQQPVMDRLAPRGTQKNINIEFLKPWPVIVPPLDEQKKIAYVLSTVQRAIAQQEQLIQTTTELKKALMHKLFTEGLHGEKQKETAIGLVPESWSLATIDSLCSIKSSSMTYQQLENLEDDENHESLVVFGVKVSDMNLKGNEIAFTTANLIRKIGKEIANKKAIPKNSIVFPKRGAAIATNKKRLTTCCTVLDPNLIAVVPSEKVDHRFLFHWFNTFDLAKITDPGPTPQLNKKDIAPLKFPFPEKGIQKQVADSIDAVDKKIETHTKKLLTLTELFRTLLHQLMTAQIRVHDIDLSGFDDLDNITPQGSTQGAD